MFKNFVYETAVNMEVFDLESSFLYEIENSLCQEHTQETINDTHQICHSNNNQTKVLANDILLYSQ